MDQVKVYKDPNLFWSEVSLHLKKEEAKNCHCLGLSYGFLTKPDDCIYQSALFRGNDLLGSLVVSRYRGNLTVTPSPVVGLGSAKQLFEEYKKIGLEIRHMVGQIETADMYRRLIEGSGVKTKAHMTLGLYKCSKLKLPKHSNSLKFRKAELADVEIVGEWIEDFNVETLAHAPSVSGVEIAKSKIASEMVFVVEKDNTVVSMAAWSRDIKTSCSVNLVFTPKTHRKNGYASFAAAKLTEHLLQSGKRETNLYTDKANSSSNKIYMDIGYEFVDDFIHIGVCE